MASGDDVRTAEIEIDSGRIRGRHNVTVFDAKPYFSFRGIPYGRAPLNELRFKVSTDAVAAAVTAWREGKKQQVGKLCRKYFEIMWHFNEFASFRLLRFVQT